MLIVAGLMGAGVMAYGELASNAVQREKEAELIFRGQQYRQAIASYYKKDGRYPQSLEELLEDKRFPMPVRHLRKLYADPITGQRQWATVQGPDGGIMGVHSASEAEPRKKGNFAKADAAFADAKQYKEWKFVHQPPEQAAQPGEETRASD